MKISFCVTYYNQEAFVKKSMDSIFSMDVPCDFEVLVGDDGSCDNTLVEIRKFTDIYPDKIKVFKSLRTKSEKTINRASSNRLNLAEKAQGDYILFLDGDDYYCNSTFVRKALDVLDKNRDIIACGGNFKYVYPDKEVIFNQTINEGKVEPKLYISKGQYTHSGAILFRNILTADRICFLRETNTFDDNAITIYMFQFGDFYYIDIPVYAYVQNPNSLWNALTEIEQVILNAMDYRIIAVMAPKFKTEIFKRQYSALKYLYKNKARLKEFLNYNFDKYLTLCHDHNDKFLANLISYSDLNSIQKVCIFVEWKMKRWLLKNGIL